MFKISCSIIEFEISCFVDEKLDEAGSYAWKMKDRVKRGFALCQGARKKRVGCSVLAQSPLGGLSLSSTPLQTESLGQCVQTCVRLFNFPFKNLLTLSKLLRKKLKWKAKLCLEVGFS